MTDSFLKSIRSLGSFSDEQIAAIHQRLTPGIYEKGELLLDQGETCHCFWFIEYGSIHSFYLDTDLDPVTVGLFVPGNWVVEQASFTAREPSKNKLQALEKTRIHALSIHDLHELIGQSQVYFQLGKILGNPEREVYRKEQGPDERYLLLLEKQPELLRIFPLKYIASYLGVTPETLSRVRKRISGIS